MKDTPTIAAHPLGYFGFIWQNLAQFFSHAPARAVGLIFLSDSVLFGTWVAHIPSVKARWNLSDGQLGLLLFAMPIGCFVMNPFTGRIVGRFGAAKTCFVTALSLSAALLVPLSASQIWLAAFGLFWAGVCAALLNVAMNTCATAVEYQSKTKIMSACHGMWSLGGMIGATLSGIVIFLGISPALHALFMCLFVATLTLFLRPIIQKIQEPPHVETASGGIVKLNTNLVLMIFVGLCLSMGEGLAFDWSAVYLKDVARASNQIAALGFAAFALAMTLGRFAGDAIIPIIGQRRILFFGGLVAASGLVLAVAVSISAVVLVGFVLLGLGCSLGAPILYAASMRVEGVAPAAGLASFATFSFVGFLAGPPLIGFVAEQFGLAHGLVMVGVLLAVSSVVSRFVKL